MPILTELVPEFDLIENVELRDRCIEVWMEAIDLGGWTIDDLDEIPFTLLIDECPASFLEHVRAVTLAAIAVSETANKIFGERFPINRDYLIAGCLLHDIGKLLEYTEVDGVYVKSEYGKLLRHPFSGVALAAQYGIPDEVLHMIATHAKEGDLGHRTPEATILYHCDFAMFEPFKR